MISGTTNSLHGLKRKHLAVINCLITAARWLSPESVSKLRGHRLMIDKTVFYCDMLFLSGLLKTVWYKSAFVCASLNLHGGQTVIWGLNCRRCMRRIKTEQIICVKPSLGERWTAALYHCKCEPLMGKREEAAVKCVAPFTLKTTPLRNACRLFWYRSREESFRTTKLRELVLLAV